jgi:hypothetical protein
MLCDANIGERCERALWRCPAGKNPAGAWLECLKSPKNGHRWFRLSGAMAMNLWRQAVIDESSDVDEMCAILSGSRLLKWFHWHDDLDIDILFDKLEPTTLWKDFEDLMKSRRFIILMQDYGSRSLVWQHVPVRKPLEGPIKFTSGGGDNKEVRVMSCAKLDGDADQNE